MLYTQTSCLPFFSYSSSFFQHTDGSPGTDKQLVLMNDQRGTLETLDAALEQNKVRKRSTCDIVS